MTEFSFFGCTGPLSASSGYVKCTSGIFSVNTLLYSYTINMTKHHRRVHKYTFGMHQASFSIFLKGKKFQTADKSHWQEIAMNPAKLMSCEAKS